MPKLQNDIQFETLPASNTENGDFKHSAYLFLFLYFTLCTCLIVTLWEFVARKQCVNVTII